MLQMLHAPIATRFSASGTAMHIPNEVYPADWSCQCDYLKVSRKAAKGHSTHNTFPNMGVLNTPVPDFVLQTGNLLTSIQLPIRDAFTVIFFSALVSSSYRN